MSDIADSLLAGMRAAPNLDPSIVYGISNSVDDPSQVPDIAQGTQAFADATKQVSFLRSMDRQHQYAAWSAAGDAQRTIWQAAGFDPPQPPGHGGLWGAIAHGLGFVAENTLVRPAEAIGHGVSEVLHYAGAPLRAVQHAYRTLSYAAEQGDNNLLNALFVDRGFRMAQEGGKLRPGLSLNLSPSDWARMWRETEHGEQTFSPLEERKIRQRYDPETADLAKQIASSNADKVILSVPEDQRQALTQRIDTDAELKQAVGDYQAAKLSVGRAIVGPDLQQRLQVTLPKAVPFIGGATFNPISGAIDAAADWWGDPLVVGSKVVKGTELARYLVQGPEDVRRLAATNTNVQRAVEDVVATLNKPHPGEGLNLGALMERWPKLAQGAGEDLARKNIDTPEKFVDWLADTEGMKAILSGRSTGVSKDAVQMLKLNPREQAMLNLKGTLKNTIDWAADSQYRIAQKTGDAEAELNFAQRRLAGMGRMARRATSLTARGAEFDPYSDYAVTNVQRFANYVLPADRVRDVVNAYTATADLAVKRNIWKGLIGEVADAAGVTTTQEGRDWLARFTSKIDDAVLKPNFSGSGADAVLRDGVDARRGLDAMHMADTWAMPSFADLYAQATRSNTLNRLFNGTVNSDLVDQFMQSAWKPLTLLRFGFPIRAGGEELVAAIMREGPAGIIKGRLALSSVEGQAAGAVDRILPYHPLARVWGAIAGHLPQELVDKVEQPSEYIGAVFGDRARRAFRSVEGRLAGERYLQAAKELFDRGELHGGAFDEISALHSRAAGYLDDVPSVRKAVLSGDNPRPAYFRFEGDYRNVAPTEDLYTLNWQRDLAELQDGPLFREAVKHIGDRDAQVQAVADKALSPGYQSIWRKSDRSIYTTDGRLVGTEATKEEAATDWANAVVDHVNSLVHNDQGLMSDLAERVRSGDIPSTVELNAIPPELRPGAVKGRDIVHVSRNWVRDAMDRGFGQIVGKPMDWMVRQPLFIHNYAKSLDEVTAGITHVMGESDHAAQVAHNVAMERAINKTVPFIHDPQLRSQFSVVTRNLAPFWFAQEQFYKRWAKMLVHSPEAFRQAQLVMSGFRHSGVLHTDDQGNDYFIYPGAAVVQGVLAKGLELLPGQAGKWSLPLPVGFSGQVRFATPGLERLGAPSFGPLVGIPMHAMAAMFPELDPVEQGVLGDRGTGRSYWEMVTPTTISRLVHIAIDRPDSSPQMASAMMQAMQYLEATGNGPPDNLDPGSIQAWQDRVRNWTRILFLNRMMFGFGVPAAPELQMDPDQLHQEFRDLMKQMPIEQAVQEFMRRHPDATPYTVFQSESASGAPLPATAAAAKFMADHGDFLTTYPQAGGWFLPQTPEKDSKFSLLAYREQLGMELRTRKTPEQFYDDLKYTEAADQYFRSRDTKDTALAGLKGNPAKANQVRSEWAQWKADFLKTHPVFARELQDPSAQIRRQAAVDQLHQALQDPRLPQTDQTDAVRTMVDAYDKVNAVMLRFAGQNSAAAQRVNASVRDQFNQWGTAFIASHPDAKPLWDRVFRYVAEGTMV